MSEFNIRSDSVDVEQIMNQIRTRIREKRGVDYTEEQVRELATVRLEKFLDPKNLRSDLLAQFRNSRPPLPEIPTDPIELPDPPKEPPPAEPPYHFDAETLYQSHRGPLRFIRRLLAPILKLFFNQNTLVQILHSQSQFNLDVIKRDLRRRAEFEQGLYELRTIQKHFERHAQVQTASFERSRAEWNLLYYEVLHNLVLETTRNGIEVKNLRMRVEALASRLDFSERRVRALEGVVQYRPELVRQRSGSGRPDNRDRDRDRDAGRERMPRADAERGGDEAPAATVESGLAPAAAAAPSQASQGLSGESTGRRRRRRRRGRRGPGAGQGVAVAASTQSVENGGPEEDFAEGDELETAVDDLERFDDAGGDDARDAADEQDESPREPATSPDVGADNGGPGAEADPGPAKAPDRQ